MAEIGEKEKSEIERKAKEILNSFASALGKVKILDQEECEKGLSGFREEGSGYEGGKDFIKRMFDNASSKNENAIIAESKKW
jgi:hypothetical protein